MKWNQVKHHWPAVQESVKRTWGRIDETDLVMIHGERDLFIRVLAQRYGYSELVAQNKVDAFIEHLKPESRSATRTSRLFQLLQDCWGHVHATGRR
ncbi:CsbD family protein [Aporhodopirellula aestuarii]|uniref:Uncharacterized protein n=1 Tax=Aporhodopirellula aestuarii TaxID=2950107 RepID=A0ABT0UDY8_9BACT|nr:hypothetical protein [Aporhodopirellula aestuarii]MCM2375046.1 hypothetical protein [Aporhodopirellula aestuarii]